MYKAKVSHLLVCALLLLSCRCCRTPGWAMRQVVKVKGSIPNPPQSELIIERFDDVSGTNECVGAAFTRVYGSQQSYDEIVAYYQAELTKLGWVDKRSEYGEPVFAKGDRSGIVIKEGIEARFSLLLSSEEAELESLLERRAPGFQTIVTIYTVLGTCLDW